MSALSPAHLRDMRGEGIAFRPKETGRGMRGLMRNQEIQDARDALACECGHKNVSHGHGDGSARWRDGSEIGLGQCGIDRDTRNHATGHVPDMCPCAAFTPDATKEETA